MSKQTRKPFAHAIPDANTARRCIKAIAEYLRRHESPQAAADLEQAVKVLIAERAALDATKAP